MLAFSVQKYGFLPTLKGCAPVAHPQKRPLNVSAAYHIAISAYQFVCLSAHQRFLPMVAQAGYSPRTLEGCPPLYAVATPQKVGQHGGFGTGACGDVLRIYYSLGLQRDPRLFGNGKLHIPLHRSGGQLHTERRHLRTEGGYLVVHSGEDGVDFTPPHFLSAINERLMPSVGRILHILCVFV